MPKLRAVITMDLRASEIAKLNARAKASRRVERTGRERVEDQLHDALHFTAGLSRTAACASLTWTNETKGTPNGWIVEPHRR